ncbi:MAG: hypothetical protein UV73_C0004G0053 [Candidatus Gottesmanbacteria bacterium GW2011_GWA2_43_14]|uniref:Uncharacterized protein n=1 Tax=Candidatus Gottesmanbacteria bacterium GW2011_GWA2_43_14 TaxID=1618443 RepID=A0A0G1FSA8_9BACT|nr:MAG: hypothetical protein UV73_C0004G0053 [Candidatus Gottesmanbacteria bacterium GW2011_GWA2_43_14]
MSQKPAPSREIEAEGEQQGFDLDQQDTATWASLVQLTGAIGAGGFQYVDETRKAFNTVNDENIHNKLLNLENPQKLQKVIYDYQLIGRRLKTPEKESTKFAFYNFKGEVTRDRFDRVGQAIIVARQIHQYTNKVETSIRFDKTIKAYGFSEETVQQLRKNLTEWQEKNPGAEIDNILSNQSKKLYGEQCAKDGKKADKNIETALKKDLTTARKEALIKVDELGVRDRAESVIKNDFLNNQNAPLKEEQIKTRLEYVFEGKIPEEKLAGVVEKTVESARTFQEPASKPLPQVGKSPLPRSFSFPQIRLSTIKISIRLPNLVGLGNLGGSLLRQGATKLAGKLAGKAVAQTALGAATGGVYNAISLLASFFGINLDDIAIKVALWAGILAVGVPAAIVVFFIFSSSNSSRLFDPQAVTQEEVFYQNSRHFAWKRFEEKNLKILDTSASWIAFEKERLDLDNRLVERLSLDPDRHNDVEK